MLKRKEKMLNEFESWCGSPCNTDSASKFAWNAWQAACANKQKEIDELKKQLRLVALEKYENTPVDPDEVYSPNTKVINE